mmetsp:Transcript_99925/g.172351  ORF Transcript_99925/g.172351 Transcript_99925/m.172351 type:complete len:169 (+) Transcript_99925:46-552(+)
MSASLNMGKTALMLACLACLCHGRRVQPLDVVNEALVASRAAPAFNPSNVPINGPDFAVARPPVRVTKMAVDAPKRGEPGYKRSALRQFINNLNPFKTGAEPEAETKNAAGASAKAKAAEGAKAAEIAKAAEAEVKAASEAVEAAFKAKAEADAQAAAKAAEAAEKGG